MYSSSRLQVRCARCLCSVAECIDVCFFGGGVLLTLFFVFALRVTLQAGAAFSRVLDKPSLPEDVAVYVCMHVCVFVRACVCACVCVYYHNNLALYLSSLSLSLILSRSLALARALSLSLPPSLPPSLPLSLSLARARSLSLPLCSLCCLQAQARERHNRALIQP